MHFEDCLEEIDWGIHVYFPNEFLENFFSNIDSEEGKLKEALQQAWWGFKFGRDRLLITEKQIKDFVRGNPIGRWQQEAGDINMCVHTQYMHFYLLKHTPYHACARSKRET